MKQFIVKIDNAAIEAWRQLASDAGISTPKLVEVAPAILRKHYEDQIKLRQSIVGQDGSTDYQNVG